MSWLLPHVFNKAPVNHERPHAKRCLAQLTNKAMVAQRKKTIPQGLGQLAKAGHLAVIVQPDATAQPVVTGESPVTGQLTVTGLRSHIGLRLQEASDHEGPNPVDQRDNGCLKKSNPITTIFASLKVVNIIASIFPPR